MLAPGNDHHEPDDGLTEAPREEEEENDEDFAGPPELISSEEEDEQVFIDGMVATLTQNGTSLTPLHIVNGALGRVQSNCRCKQLQVQATETGARCCVL